MRWALCPVCVWLPFVSRVLSTCGSVWCETLPLAAHVPAPGGSSGGAGHGLTAQPLAFPVVALKRHHPPPSKPGGSRGSWREGLPALPTVCPCLVGSARGGAETGGAVGMSLWPPREGRIARSRGALHACASRPAPAARGPCSASGGVCAPTRGPALQDSAVCVGLASCVGL